MASSNVTAVTNHFSTANEGFITTAGGTIAPAATVVPLTSTAGLTNGTIFVGIIEPGATNQQTFTGTVDTGGSQITGVKWTRGTNISHVAGVTIVDYVSGTGHNMVTKGLLVSLDQDGTLKSGAVDTTTVLADSVVTSNKLALNTGQSNVITQESTGSTTYVGLTTPQAFSVTVGVNGTLLLSYSALLLNNAANNQSYMSFSLSGANTLAASDSNGDRYQTYAVNAFGGIGRTILLTGLAPGATTVTALYRATGGTSFFEGRRISAIAL